MTRKPFGVAALSAANVQLKSNGFSTALLGSNAASANLSFTLPSSLGLVSQVITTDGSGNLFFSNVSATFAGLSDASTADLDVHDIAVQAKTTFVVTANGSSAYRFDINGTTDNPTIYVRAGETIAFDLTGLAGAHPFQIQTDGGAPFNTGLIHVAVDGTRTTDSAAQEKTSGTLYWKVPASISGIYEYQCTSHGIMNGAIEVEEAAGAAAASGGGTFSVALSNASNSLSNVTSNISTIAFDTDSGFDIVDLGNNAVKVLMNSTFKFWEVEGQDTIIAEGLDTINIAAGDGIAISTNASSKTLTIAAVPGQQGGVPGEQGGVPGEQGGDILDDQFIVASSNVFALSQSVSSANNILVSLGGIVQSPDIHYSVSGTSLLFNNTIPLTQNVQVGVRYLQVIGSSPTVTVGSGINFVDSFSVSGNSNVFTLSASVTATSDLLVLLDGVLQATTSYAIDGAQLTLANVIPLSTGSLEVRSISSITSNADTVINTSFAIDGSTNAFTLPSVPSSAEGILVSIDGLVQHPDTYSVSGSILTLANSVPLPTSKLAVRSLGSGGGTAGLDIIRTPIITSPSANAVVSSFTPEIVGSAYAPLYSADTRDYRQFQVDEVEGDFSSPVADEQANTDSRTLVTELSSNTAFKVRIRDVSVANVSSAFSTVVAFSTPDVLVNIPTLTVPGSPTSVTETPTLTTSEFSTSPADQDTHDSTDWEIRRTSNSELIYSSISDSVNLLSIEVPGSTLEESTEYEFRARHVGTSFGAGEYAEVTASTGTFAPSLGDSLCGGYYIGTICAASTCYYLIVAPNASGCAQCQWKTTRTTTAGTTSCVDGRANTYGPLNNGTHPAGNWTATRTIGGFSDWYLPARDELNQLYVNAGSAPAGEGFAAGVYWSSTEASATAACTQTFSNGSQYSFYGKTGSTRVRAVRREPV